MSAIRIDGKQISQQIRSEIAERVAVLKQRGVTPGLAVSWWEKIRPPGVCAQQGARRIQAGHGFPSHPPSGRHPAGKPDGAD